MSQMTDHTDKVAQLFIELIQKDLAPFQRPWSPGQPRHTANQMPVNGTSGRGYNGINALYLHMQQLFQNYESNAWMTFKQASDMGGKVIKGQKSTLVEYWDWPKKTTGDDASNIPSSEAPEEARKGPRVFYAHVFNASQIEGLPERFYAPPVVIPEVWRHQEAERLIEASGAVIKHDGGNQAFYRPMTDSIHLPMPDQFESRDALLAVEFHEIGHWTGAPHRLNRTFGRFGDEAYAQEELRAEIFSYMVSQRLDLPHDPERHAGYVKSWVKVVQNDPRAIFKACADAERMCKFLGVEYANAKVEAFQAEQKQESNVLTFPAKEELVLKKQKSRGLAL